MVRPSSLAALGALGVVLLGPAVALAVRAPHQGSSGGLEPAPGVAAARAAPSTAYDATPPSRRRAWARFVAEVGPGRWTALWDTGTRVPLRVFGPGVAAPGTTADPGAAEAHARAFLARHLDLFAPGASADDFELSANRVDRGLRTVAFVQTARLPGGARVPVIGGQVSFRYRADRLFVIGSEALPDVATRPLAIPPTRAVAAARAFVAADHAGVVVESGASAAVLPLVRAAGVELRTAYRVEVSAEQPVARYAVYVDAETGAPIARDEELRFASGTARMDAPVRGPAGERKLYPVRLGDLTIDGASSATDDGGGFTWAGPGPGQVALFPHGASIEVNDMSGNPATQAFSVDDGGSADWSLADDETGDAQLSAFIHARIAKERARLIVPSMPFLTSAQTFVRVNRPDPYGCNAFWDGTAINLLRETWPCNNTARVADVVYHEFGHGFHQHSIIHGAGALDPSLGEGCADYMAATTTGDPHIAPGFYTTNPDDVLRDIGVDRVWPDDLDPDPHETGRIIGGALWDLRSALVDELGQDAGVALADQLYEAVLQRASSIPAAYAEALAADDDDGDIENGTPHVCAINDAFARHGIADVLDASGLRVHHVPLSVVPAGGASYAVKVTTERLYPSCASAGIEDAEIVWGPRGGAKQTIPLVDDEEGGLSAEIPAEAGGAFEYQIVIHAGGAARRLPDNAADPFYRVFVGAPVPIHCSDFETQSDFTFGSDEGPSDFAWGPPGGQGGDPAAAHSGSSVIGDVLDGDGRYRAHTKVHADGPAVDITGRKHVRLQFWRWLTVEDGALDQASILANGHPVWQNASTSPDVATLAHRDLEWRFEDIDLGPALAAAGEPTAQVRFELDTSNSGQLGGWTIDDVCLVEVPDPAPPASGAGGGGAGGEGGAMDAFDAGTVVAEGGCGCSVPAPSGSHLSWALLAIAPLLRRRRRVSRR